jgi:hypothetical protein
MFSFFDNLKYRSEVLVEVHAILSVIPELKSVLNTFPDLKNVISKFKQLQTPPFDAAANAFSALGRMVPGTAAKNEALTQALTAQGPALGPIGDAIGDLLARRIRPRGERRAGLCWGSSGELRPMTDKYPPTKQRPALLAFAEACGTRASALRRDECGDWAIWGSNGHVYAVPEGFQMMIGCDFDNNRWSSAKGWESAKARLNFGAVTQDGDMEGSIILARLPAKSEAETIRAVLGIPKRVELSAGQLANLKAHAAVNAFKPLLPAPGAAL